MGSTAHATQDQIKQQYRKASLKSHPDKTPAGLEIAKAIVSANSRGTLAPAINTASLNKAIDNRRAANRKEEALSY